MIFFLIWCCLVTRYFKRCCYRTLEKWSLSSNWDGLELRHVMLSVNSDSYFVLLMDWWWRVYCERFRAKVRVTRLFVEWGACCLETLFLFFAMLMNGVNYPCWPWQACFNKVLFLNILPICKLAFFFGWYKHTRLPQKELKDLGILTK